MTDLSLEKQSICPLFDFLIQGTYKNEQKASHLRANEGQFIFCNKKAKTSLSHTHTHTQSPMPLSLVTEM